MNRLLSIVCLVVGLTAGAVELTVQPRNSMALVEAAVDGVACTLLVDTGASHTTLDLNFVTNALKGATLHEVQLMGRTNVALAPKFVETRALTIGDVTLETEGLMALDLGHLHQAVGRRVDGILGMNHLRTRPCILSLARRQLIWDPAPEACASFRPLRTRDRGTTFEVLTKTPNGSPIALLVDTGSTYTFVDERLWPKDDEELKMGTADVNVRAEQTFRRGAAGEITCGDHLSLTIRPVLTRETNRNQLGADLFQSVDLLILPNQLQIRKDS